MGDVKQLVGNLSRVERSIYAFYLHH